MKGGAIKSPIPILHAWLHKLKPYAGVAVFLLLAGVYGYMVLYVNSLSSPTIDESEVMAQATAAPTPRIDAKAAEQLQTLKDNSVSVQTLFEQGRKNPFSE